QNPASDSGSPAGGRPLSHWKQDPARSLCPVQRPRSTLATQIGHYPRSLPLSRLCRARIFASMNVFVTGGAGYIGSVCVEELLNAGHKVTVFDNLSEGHRAAVDTRAQFIEGDLAVPAQLAAALREAAADAILHFAANALVGELMTNPTKYFRNNVAH